MADIEKYSDLNEKELLNFLAEIKEDDEELEEIELDANEKINRKKADEEANLALLESPENAEIEAYYGDDAWRQPGPYIGYGEKLTVLYGPYGKQKTIEGVRNATRRRASKLKEDRIRIQREAFNQQYIKLSDDIEKQYIKLLISILVEEHTRMVDKYANYINKRLTTLLNPFIPRRLRMCKMIYPNSIRMSPGFMYKASEEFGKGLTFWATPSIPYYFKQNTEQQVLLKNKPAFLHPIDRAVLLYHDHFNNRQTKELKYASLIVQKCVVTYFDLLKLNPFWFEILYNEIKNETKD